MSIPIHPTTSSFLCTTDSLTPSLSKAHSLPVSHRLTHSQSLTDSLTPSLSNQEIFNRLRFAGCDYLVRRSIYSHQRNLVDKMPGSRRPMGAEGLGLRNLILLVHWGGGQVCKVLSRAIGGTMSCLAGRPTSKVGAVLILSNCLTSGRWVTLCLPVSNFFLDVLLSIWNLSHLTLLFRSFTRTHFHLL